MQHDRASALLPPDTTGLGRGRRPSRSWIKPSGKPGTPQLYGNSSVEETSPALQSFWRSCTSLMREAGPQGRCCPRGDPVPIGWTLSALAHKGCFVLTSCCSPAPEGLENSFSPCVCGISSPAHHPQSHLQKLSLPLQKHRWGAEDIHPSTLSTPAWHSTVLPFLLLLVEAGGWGGRRGCWRQFPNVIAGAAWRAHLQDLGNLQALSRKVGRQGLSCIQPLCKFCWNLW